MHDLAKDAAYAKLLEELKGKLDAWHNDVPSVPTIAGLNMPTYEAGNDAQQPKRGGKKRTRGKQR